MTHILYFLLLINTSDSSKATSCMKLEKMHPRFWLNDCNLVINANSKSNFWMQTDFFAKYYHFYNPLLLCWMVWQFFFWMKQRVASSCVKSLIRVCQGKNQKHLLSSMSWGVFNVIYCVILFESPFNFTLILKKYSSQFLLNRLYLVLANFDLPISANYYFSSIKFVDILKNSINLIWYRELTFRNADDVAYFRNFRDFLKCQHTGKYLHLFKKW